MAWIDEKLKLLQGATGAIILNAGPEWGTYEIVAGLGTPACPVVWLPLTTDTQSDPIALGVLLSDAIRKAFGSPLFGYGVSVDHGVAILRRYTALLNPYVLAVTCADKAPDLSEKLLREFSDVLQVVITTAAPIPASWSENASGPLRIITARDLRLTSNQARAASRGLRDQELQELLRKTDGAYVPFSRAIAEQLNLPKPRLASDEHEDNEFPEAPSKRELFEILLRRKKWMEALELAVYEFPERVVEVVDGAGNMFFDRGLFEGLWRLLSRLPERVSSQESVLYWLFSASLAVRRQNEVVPIVEEVLAAKAAPDLRALYAASGFARDPLSEAEIAYANRRSAITANFYGFVLATHSDPAAAISHLEEALDLFEKQGNQHRVVSSAMSLCDAYIHLGQYSTAAYWATWALQEYSARDLREELLRYHATSLLAYVKLLLGELQTGTSLLEPLQLTDEILGIPSMEVVVSTMGDYALVGGDADTAFELYELVRNRFSRRFEPYAVNDMIRALVHLGDLQQAEDIAAAAASLAASGNDFERQRALLALGTARAVTAPEQAIPLLEGALDYYLQSLSAPLLAQAGIHLAKLHVRRGDLEEARSSLFRADRGLRELSKAGWLLLGGPENEIQEVWELWNVDATPIELRFLGSRKLRVEHRTMNYPLRWCEILAVLAFHPEGLNGERLSSLLYGDGGNMSTLKANLSRMRKDVPVSSRPYRIELPYQADFVDLDTALREGRIRDALELYHGPLLPESDAPFVVELREYLEETLRQAALNLGDVDVLLSLARKLSDDLELWEATSTRLSHNDPLLPLAKAHVKRIQRSWG